MSSIAAWRRSAGVLIHVSSLPGHFGIGDLGPMALDLIDRLAQAGQRWWQFLPLGPTGFGDSPYQSFSAFAGNPLLLSPERLFEDGLVTRDELADARLPAGPCDYGRVYVRKNALLERAWERFRFGVSGFHVDQVEDWRARTAWVDDYALFLALKGKFDGKRWLDWPRELVRRQKAELARARKELDDRVRFEVFRQFLFHRQWSEVREHAKARGVGLIGDMPIFVAGDSADVWCRPDLFLVDRERRPKFVAGVPPDCFAEDGQLWGNPLYDWPAHVAEKFAWWTDRFRATLAMVDLIRVDHFRGFEAFWKVPADAPNARHGVWTPAPGGELFATLAKNLGGLPVIAEDLGLITPEVDALRRRFGLPGMAVLQFGFDGSPDNRYLPHLHEPRSACYTGTHDNPTTNAWHRALDRKAKAYWKRYVPRDGLDPAKAMIRLAWSGVADLAIAPAQDLLSLGDSARMNFPGKPAGNWQWRLRSLSALDEPLAQLREWTETYGRLPPAAAAEPS